MPSSLIPAARRQPLADLLSQVLDQRKQTGRRHPLAGLLAVGIAAVTAGARSFAAIGQWAADAGPDVVPAWARPAARPTSRPTGARSPRSEPTYSTRFFGTWLWTRAAAAGGRLVIAVDGESNEIPAVRELLKASATAPSAGTRPGSPG